MFGRKNSKIMLRRKKYSGSSLSSFKNARGTLNITSADIEIVHYPCKEGFPTPRTVNNMRKRSKTVMSNLNLGSTEIKEPSDTEKSSEQKDYINRGENSDSTPQNPLRSVLMNLMDNNMVYEKQRSVHFESDNRMSGTVIDGLISRRQRSRQFVLQSSMQNSSFRKKIIAIQETKFEGTQLRLSKNILSHRGQVSQTENMNYLNKKASFTKSGLNTNYIIYKSGNSKQKSSIWLESSKGSRVSSSYSSFGFSQATLMSDTEIENNNQEYIDALKHQSSFDLNKEFPHVDDDEPENNEMVLPRLHHSRSIKKASSGCHLLVGPIDKQENSFNKELFIPEAGVNEKLKVTDIPISQYIINTPKSKSTKILFQAWIVSNKKAIATIISATIILYINTFLQYFLIQQKHTSILLLWILPQLDYLFTLVYNFRRYTYRQILNPFLCCSTISNDTVTNNSTHFEKKNSSFKKYKFLVYNNNYYKQISIPSNCYISLKILTSLFIPNFLFIAQFFLNAIILSMEINDKVRALVPMALFTCQVLKYQDFKYILKYAWYQTLRFIQQRFKSPEENNFDYNLIILNQWASSHNVTALEEWVISSNDVTKVYLWIGFSLLIFVLAKFPLVLLLLLLYKFTSYHVQNHFEQPFVQILQQLNPNTFNLHCFINQILISTCILVYYCMRRFIESVIIGEPSTPTSSFRPFFGLNLFYVLMKNHLTISSLMSILTSKIPLIILYVLTHCIIYRYLKIVTTHFYIVQLAKSTIWFLICELQSPIEISKFLLHFCVVCFLFRGHIAHTLDTFES